jgi:hypothetical protein
MHEDSNPLGKTLFIKGFPGFGNWKKPERGDKEWKLDE